MGGALALLTVLAAGATPPLAVTLDDRAAADAVVAALVARGHAVIERDDGRAPLVLAGRSRWDDVRSELLGPNLHRVDLALGLRLIRRADERVLGAFELTGRGLGVTREAAVRHAAREAVASLADGLAQALARAAAEDERSAATPPPASAEPRGAAPPRSGDPRARGAGLAPARAAMALEPRTVDPREDPRGLRLRLGQLRIAGAPMARRARVDARPLARAVETATIPPSAEGAPLTVALEVSLDPEVVLRRAARGPAPVRVWLEGHEDAAELAAVDVLPVDADLALMWRAHHHLLAGRPAEARALYAEALAAPSSRLRAPLLFGAAVAARADRDLAGAGAMIADCLAEHRSACEPWVEAWARGATAPPLGWAP